MRRCVCGMRGLLDVSPTRELCEERLSRASGLARRLFAGSLPGEAFAAEGRGGPPFLGLAMITAREGAAFFLLPVGCYATQPGMKRQLQWILMSRSAASERGRMGRSLSRSTADSSRSTLTASHSSFSPFALPLSNLRLDQGVLG